MRTIIGMFIFIAVFLFGNAVNAQPIVGVIFDAPSVFTSDENKMQQLDNKLMGIFPAEKCNLLPSKMLTDKAQAYRSMHNMLADGEPDADKPLSSAILCELGKQEGCAYILLLEMKRLGQKNEIQPEYQKFNGRITTFGEKKSLVIMSLTDIQVLDTNSGQYEYKHEFLSVGQTTTSKILGIGSNPKESKTMNDLFGNFIEKLEIKASAIP